MNISADALVNEIQIAGFKPTAVHQTVVVGERKIAGHPGWYRVIHFHQGAQEWQGVVHLKRPTRWDMTEWEYAPEPLSERHLLVNIEQVSLWLGGAVSLPLDATEVSAILNRAA